MKQNLLKTFIAAAAIVLGSTGAMAQETYYSNDYENQTITWTTSVSGRYTPVILTENDNNYLSVDADTRNNNGCILTSTETEGKVAANANFTFICKVKLGASNNQTTTEFGIYDATNVTKILSIAEGSTYATAWKINGSDQTATVSAGGGLTIDKCFWVNLQVTWKDGITYLTLTDETGNTIDGYDKTIITTTSENGGLGKLEFVTSRYSANFAIDDIVVREVLDTDVPEVTLSDYTINYQFDGNTISTETKTAVAGTVIEAVSPITIDGKKYYFAEGATTSLTVAENSDNILNVALREAETYSYTVKNSFGDVLATGSTYEGETVSVGFPQYVNKEGTLWEAARTSTTNYYNCSFEPTSNGYEHSITYTETSIANVVYFSEAENIEGLEATSSGNANVRCSNALGGYGADGAEITTLAPGKYKITLVVWGGSGSTIAVNNGEEILYSLATTGSITSGTSDEITIEETTTLTLSGATNVNRPLDYIYIVKTGDATEEVTIGSAGAATYAPKANVLVPEGVTVYTVTVNDDQTSVTITEVNGALQAGKGYVIEGAEGTYSFTYAGDAAVENNANNLIVAEEGGRTAIVDDNLYVLAQRTDGSVGFSRVKAETTIPAGKAYLDLGVSVAAKPAFLTIGQPTAVEGVEAAAASAPVEYISLQGIRTTTPKGGIYIVNGKAVLVK